MKNSKKELNTNELNDGIDTVETNELNKQDGSNSSNSSIDSNTSDGKSKLNAMVVIDSPLLTITHAAAMLELSDKYLRKLCSSNQLKAYKKARQWYILKEDLVKWVKSK